MQNVLMADRPREELASLFNSDFNGEWRKVRLEMLSKEPLRRGHVRVGFWRGQSGDPLPDFIIVRDEELADTSAWLSAFLPGLSPISQWCRVLSISGADKISGRYDAARSTFPVGAWVGAAIAELSLQLPRSSALKELSGVALKSSLSFALGRAAFVWDTDELFATAVSRYVDLQKRLATPRSLDVKRLSALWSTLAGSESSRRDDELDSELSPFRVAFRNFYSPGGVAPDHLVLLAKEVAGYYGINELARCASGTQADRVDALDEVARRLSQSKSMRVPDAVLGFSASLIDPGAAVLPDLLKRHSDIAPLAAIWAGAFAGVWSPIRVLSDSNGLGRLVAKELCANSDLFSKPDADIGYDELIKWIGGSDVSSVKVRGLHSRTLNVELIHGVSVPIYYAPDQHRQDSRLNSAEQRQHAFNLERNDAKTARSQGNDVALASSETGVSVDDLASRLLAVEQFIGEMRAKANRSNKTTKRSTV